MAGYLRSLSGEKRKQVEADALASSLFGSTASDLIRQSLIHNHVMELLKETNGAEK